MRAKRRLVFLRNIAFEKFQFTYNVLAWFRSQNEKHIVKLQLKFIFRFVNITISAEVQLQFVEHSNRRKMKSYSIRRKNSISAIIFFWLYFVAISIFVVWLGGFAPFAK